MYKRVSSYFNLKLFKERIKRNEKRKKERNLSHSLRKKEINKERNNKREKTLSLCAHIRTCVCDK
nr:MAG TPA: hypothetical protein [Caudoviricetes sp.]